VRRRRLAAGCVAAAALVVSATAASAAQERSWPSFRGPRASGVAVDARPPVTWDATTGANLLWKAEIPGVGHSSPVVWGERVFVTTAVSSAEEAEFLHGRTDTSRSARDISPQSWRVYCLDRSNGDVVWQRTLHEGEPRTPRHLKASYANPTPATNGRQLVVFFGSEGLYALDLDGNLLWSRDLGTLDGGYTPLPDAHWGFASSPVIHEELVFVQGDAQNQSFLAAFDLGTGDPVWRVVRDEDTSWSTPTVVEGGGRTELVVSGTRHHVAYDPATGEELWRLAADAAVKIATPIAAQGMVLVGGGELAAKPRFYAVRRGASGTIPTDEGKPSAALAWWNEARPHVVTPLAYEGVLYVCTDSGILTLYDLSTGERLNRVRVGNRSASFSASPVAAAGKVYFAGEDGEVFVLRAGEEATLLAENPIGEVIFATPAISGDTLIVRGQRHLFALAGDGAR
jgi:outer membrane protein assembly factor BamB